MRQTRLNWLVAFALVACSACTVTVDPGQDDPPAGAAEITEEDSPMTTQAQHDRRMDYIEFPSTDIARTRAFYAEVFGWKFTDYGPDYTSFEDGRLTGGFRSAPEARAGGPLVVIYAKDLAAMKDRVAAHGGTIVRDIFEFPGGRRFHFTDPGGNELAVWSDR